MKRVGEQIEETILTHQRPAPSAAEIKARVQELLTQVGLPNPPQLANSYPFELSGGQRQRVMIAMAMSNQPALLIADEPTTALDVTTQRQILRLIDDLRRDRGMGVLLITHDFGVVADVADRVVVLRHGKVVEHGTVEEVLRHPREAYTRELIDAVPKARVKHRETATQAAPLLDVVNLRKTFRVKRGWFQPPREVLAADGISLTLHEGETLAVVGESGSGKSTLGRMVMRLTEPDSGAIRLGSQDLRQLRGEALRQARRGLQIMFQDPFSSLDPRQKVGDAVARGPMAYGTSRTEAMAQARQLLARVGLTPSAADRYPHEFSGGQRQRICIARALALRPKVLIADEAVSALDVSVQAQVLALLAELRREIQLAMIFITHDLRIAAEIADRVIVLQHGRIVEEGPTARVLHPARGLYARPAGRDPGPPLFRAAEFRGNVRCWHDANAPHKLGTPRRSLFRSRTLQGLIRVAKQHHPPSRRRPRAHRSRGRCRLRGAAIDDDRLLGDTEHAQPGSAVPGHDGAAVARARLRGRRLDHQSGRSQGSARLRPGRTDFSRARTVVGTYRPPRRPGDR